jgi:ubiquinone/menaquinone biosynthesis C-methylase UbiE
MNATAKAYKGMGMDGSMARWYDRTTRKDMPEFQKLAARIAAMMPAGGQVLEIAPGPGFLSIELAKRGLQVRAVDISKTFVEIGRSNAKDAKVAVQFEQGNAAALPLEDSSVDFVVCRAAFKNFSEPVKALKEMKRVLRSGGTALLIDLRRDAPLADINRYVDDLGVNFLSRMFMKLVFRHMLIKRAYPLAEIRQMGEEAGWREMTIETSPVGFEARMQK